MSCLWSFYKKIDNFSRLLYLIFTFRLVLFVSVNFFTELMWKNVIASAFRFRDNKLFFSHLIRDFFAFHGFLHIIVIIIIDSLQSSIAIIVSVKGYGSTHKCTNGNKSPHSTTLRFIRWDSMFWWNADNHTSQKKKSFHIQHEQQRLCRRLES